MTQQHKPQGDHIPQVFKRITYTEISSSSNECNPPPIQEIFSTTNAHHPPNTHTHTHTLRCKDSCHPCRERNLLQLPEDQWGGSNTKNTWSHSITLEHLNAKTSKLRRPRTQPLTQQELILSIFPGANIYQYTNIPAPRLMPPDAHPNMIQSQLTRKRNQVLAFPLSTIHRFYNYEIRIEQHRPHGTKSPLTKSIPEAYDQNSQQLLTYWQSQCSAPIQDRLHITFLAFL